MTLYQQDNTLRKELTLKLKESIVQTNDEHKCSKLSDDKHLLRFHTSSYYVVTADLALLPSLEYIKQKQNFHKMINNVLNQQTLKHSFSVCSPMISLL